MTSAIRYFSRHWDVLLHVRKPEIIPPDCYPSNPFHALHARSHPRLDESDHTCYVTYMSHS